MFGAIGTLSGLNDKDRQVCNIIILDLLRYSLISSDKDNNDCILVLFLIIYRNLLTFAPR